MGAPKRPLCTRNDIPSRNGFTLFEMLIVSALLGTVVVLTFSFASSSLFRAHTEGERDLVVALLLTARTRSLAHVDEAAHGVRIDTARHRYTTYEKRDGCFGTTTMSADIPIESNGQWSGALEYCFEALTAQVSDRFSGTTTLTHGAESLSVHVNTIGRIDW